MDLGIVETMKGCEHKKDHGCIWCHACGAKRAGPKPKKTFRVGWWAVVMHDMDYPGCVIAVQINLLGLAVEHQSWSEEVVIHYGGGTWRGPASNAKRLVLA